MKPEVGQHWKWSDFPTTAEAFKIVKVELHTLKYKYEDSCNYTMDLKSFTLYSNNGRIIRLTELEEALL